MGGGAPGAGEREAPNKEARSAISAGGVRQKGKVRREECRLGVQRGGEPGKNRAGAP